MAVLKHGREGEIYNIGGNCRLTNREVIDRVLETVGAPATLIRTVADRPGYDRRYALRSEKVARDTGFVPEVAFESGLKTTVQWYRDNTDWTRRVRSGEYREYYRTNHAWRGALDATS
jgi:dTDP-glucose 4,6-dehydratase